MTRGNQKSYGRLCALVLAGVLMTPLLHASPQPAPQNPLIDQGRAALQQDDIDNAVDLLQKAVTAEPGSADAHYWLGNAYGRLALKANIFRRLSLARKTRAEFERAVELNPDDVDARFALVQFYTMAPGFAGGSTAKAYTQAAEIASRNPQKGRMALAFVQTHGRSGGMPQSLDDPAAQQAMHAAPQH